MKHAIHSLSRTAAAASATAFALLAAVLADGARSEGPTTPKEPPIGRPAGTPGVIAPERPLGNQAETAGPIFGRERGITANMKSEAKREQQPVVRAKAEPATASAQTSAKAAIASARAASSSAAAATAAATAATAAASAATAAASAAQSSTQRKAQVKKTPS